MELVSIIVPAYNAEKYIKRCIESILNQTYPNIEIVVVDDGSKDNTYDIVAHMAESDDRLKIYRQENQGVSAARNYGIKMAAGKYVGFVDSDDYIKEQMYENMVKHIEKCDLVLCNHLILTDIEKNPPASYPEGEYNNKNIIEAIFDHRLGGNVWRCLLKKEIIENNHIFFKKLKMSEDMLFVIEYLLNAPKAVVLDGRYYVYNMVNESSAVQNLGNVKYLDDLVIYPTLLADLFKKYEMDNIFVRQIANEYVITAMSIRLMLPYRKFKSVCKKNEFRSALDKKIISVIEDRKYKLYYWGLCNNKYFVCNLGYLFNACKTRTIRLYRKFHK